MFERFDYIPLPHRTALEAAVRRHSLPDHVTAQKLAQMYTHAHNGLKQAATLEGYLTSRLLCSPESGQPGVVSSITEMRTGLWLQLAVVGTAPAQLTMGQKWTAEAKSEHGSTSSFFW